MSNQSRFCYPDTDTLINKLDEENFNRLEDMESAITQFRLSQLYLKPLQGSFDIEHVQRIHKYIFQDLYSFAGEFREELIHKGTTTFAAPLHIHENGVQLLDKQLRSENYLRNLTK
ncbi:Fic family protein [Terribacillus aidingensis]|uniref:Fic family protein n=1 Tax=Terribacillus aidingensis TaxID=586416 RepID=UPI000BE43E9F